MQSNMFLSSLSWELAASSGTGPLPCELSEGGRRVGSGHVAHLRRARTFVDSLPRLPPLTCHSAASTVPAVHAVPADHGGGGAGAL